MRTKPKRYSLWTSSAAILFFILVVSALIYTAGGHLLIKVLYHGTGWKFLDTIIGARHLYSLNFYFHLADHLFLKYALYLGLAALFLVLPPNAKVSVFSLFLLWGAAETGLRIHQGGFNRLYTKNSDESIFWSYDPMLGWKNTAGAEGIYESKINRFRAKVKINSQGLREPEDTGLTKKGKRILCLGDSVLAGFEAEKEKGVDEQLEQRLRPRGNYEVINAGTRGYGTDQSFLYLMTAGYLWSPDIIIYFFADNDPEDNITIHRPSRKFGKSYFLAGVQGLITLQGIPVPREFPQPSRWQMSDKKVESFFNQSLEREEPRSHSLPELIRKDFSNSLAYAWAASRVDHSKWIQAHWHWFPRLLAQNDKTFRPLGPLPDFVTESEWQMTEKLILEMAQFSASLKARFLVFETSVQKQNSREETRLQKVCSRLGIDYLNAFAAFEQKTALGRSLVYPLDPHWNELGHETAAQALYQFLLSNRWVE